jgi:hypothetical protein
MQWNTTGRREGAYPIVLHIDEHGQTELFSQAMTL